MSSGAREAGYPRAFVTGFEGGDGPPAQLPRRNIAGDPSHGKTRDTAPGWLEQGWQPARDSRSQGAALGLSAP